MVLEGELYVCKGCSGPARLGKGGLPLHRKVAGDGRDDSIVEKKTDLARQMFRIRTAVGTRQWAGRRTTPFFMGGN